MRKEKWMAYPFEKAAKSWLLILIALALAAAVTGGVILHSYAVEDDSSTAAQEQAGQEAQSETDENGGAHEHQDEDGEHAYLDGGEEAGRDGEKDEEAGRDGEKDEKAGRDGEKDEEAGRDGEKDEEDGEAIFASMSRQSKIALLLIAAVIGIVAVTVWLFLAAWLYQAAEKAGMNGTIWGLLGLIGFVLAAAAFLIVRGLRPCCPVCGKRQPSESYCRYCGAPMKERCASCGKTIPSGSAHCPHCGKAQKE